MSETASAAPSEEDDFIGKDPADPSVVLEEAKALRLRSERRAA